MNKLRPALIVFGLLIYCLAFQGARGLYERDEGRYTAVASEMIRLDDWVTPRLQFEHGHWTKPPLTYWAIAASLKLAGPSEFAARLPMALAYFLTIGLVWFMGTTYLDRRAWVAPLIYGSFLFPFAASNMVTTDVLLTMWLTAGVCAFVKATWGNSGRERTMWLTAMGALFGIAFMTKGPAGLVPLVAILFFAAFMSTGIRARKLAWFLAMLAFLIFAVPWFAVVIREHPELGSYFVRDELIGRAAGKQHRNAEWYGAFAIYGPVFFLGTLPWTHLVIREVFRGTRNLARGGIGYLRSLPEQTRFMLLWLTWMMFVLLVVRSRLPLYSLPLFAPLSLLLARRIADDSSLWTPWRFRMLGAWLVLLLVVRVGAAQVPIKYDARALSRAFDDIPSDLYEEVAFYRTRSVHGLTFYLDKEIEDIDRDSIVEELTEDERRLWVVEDGNRAELERLVRKHSGRQLEEVGLLKAGHSILREAPVAPRRVCTIRLSH